MVVEDFSSASSSASAASLANMEVLDQSGGAASSAASLATAKAKLFDEKLLRGDNTRQAVLAARDLVTSKGAEHLQGLQTTSTSSSSAVEVEVDFTTPTSVLQADEPPIMSAQRVLSLIKAIFKSGAESWGNEVPT